MNEARKDVSNDHGDAVILNKREREKEPNHLQEQKSRQSQCLQSNRFRNNMLIKSQRPQNCENRQGDDLHGPLV